MVFIRLYYEFGFYGALMMQKSILIPLPRRDFDPSETGIPWQTLTQKRIDVVFATPEGKPAVCDPIMLTGDGLGPFSSFLRADHQAQTAYLHMSHAEAFNHPIPWNHVNPEEYRGLLLPGGHAKGMREYLESPCLQSIVQAFFQTNKPVGAICHGVLLAARSRLPSGKSVLYGRKTTALLAAQELSAWALTKVWMRDYYRTYPQTVESEVKSFLASKRDFIKGLLPILRDNPQQLQRGFTVCDGNYVSARWPGDAHVFSQAFIALLERVSV